MKHRVALIADNHFIYSLDGKVYVNGTYTKQYLSRFTSNFDDVVVIGRGREKFEEDNIAKLRESGGDNVSFCFLKDFYGIVGYLQNKSSIRKKIEEQLKSVDAIIIRMPCILTTVALSCAKKCNIPVLIDVGADPETIYEGAANKIVTSFLSMYLKHVCKKSCLSANGVSYVTRNILQKKYPCRALIKGESDYYFTASISNVDISQDFYFKERLYKKLDPVIRLIHISNIIPQKSAKGHPEAIEVLSLLRKKGINAELTFLGDGEGIKQLEDYARELNVLQFVKFVGRIADRETYRNYMINSDIFLFPSHSEGLPRVVLEAMATGLVCVTSNVDGIPEIIDEDDVFDYSDIQGMANRIMVLKDDIDLLNRISKNNLEISMQYSHNIMKNTYDAYYLKVRRLMDFKRGN